MIRYMVMKLITWDSLELVPTNPIWPFPARVVSTDGEMEGSYGFVLVFNEYEKALAFADGRAELVKPIEWMKPA